MAKRSGLTVRTLHHYDTIGLLAPSARSESGYRLYDDQDVARLHGIQTLRGMGLTLAEIGALLEADQGASLPALIARQIAALDEEIARHHELRSRLALMHTVLATGGKPALDDWLGGLALMSTCAQYFNAEELKRIFQNWTRTEAEWPGLVAEVRAAMDAGVPADAMALQPLARRWIDLTMRWMGGDTRLLKRWRQMLEEQPDTRTNAGIDRAMLRYIDQVIHMRVAVLAKYLSTDELSRFDKTLEFEWRGLSDRARRLMQLRTPPEAAAAQTLAQDWRALLARATGHDAVLSAKLMAAYANEPLLQAGSVLAPDVRDYIHRAVRALDPHTA